VVNKMEWTYSSTATYAHGPQNWGQVNSDCNGATQSPIDISTKYEKYVTAIDDTTPASENVTQGLQNFVSATGSCRKYKGYENLNTWKVQLDDCLDESTSFKFTLPSSAKHNAGVETSLKQFHIHSPSENTLDGAHFDAEMHLVHFIGDAPAAVIGVMVQAVENAPDNEFLKMFWGTFDNKHYETTKDINPYTDLLPQSAEGYISDYWSFSGSLTTPPCSMGASWILLKDPITISYAQLDVYKARLAHLPQTSESLVNNRPVQALNGREVTLLYKESASA
jgi:carbonic anhydrase